MGNVIHTTQVRQNRRTDQKQRDSLMYDPYEGRFFVIFSLPRRRQQTLTQNSTYTDLPILVQKKPGSPHTRTERSNYSSDTQGYTGMPFCVSSSWSNRHNKLQVLTLTKGGIFVMKLIRYLLKEIHA